MQALEGEEVAVRALYDRIAHDPRHREVTLLVALQVPERQFPGAPMDFCDLEEVGPECVPDPAKVATLARLEQRWSLREVVALGFLAGFAK